MAERGHPVIETGVGDRYVLEEMNERRLLARRRAVRPRDHAATSPPRATASSPGCTWSPRWRARGKSLAELAVVHDGVPADAASTCAASTATGCADEGVADAVAAAERELGDTGRVLLRPSGTEPMVRVMVEAAAQETAERVAEELAEVVEERLALDAASGPRRQRCAITDAASRAPVVRCVALVRALSVRSGQRRAHRTAPAASDLAEQDRAHRVVGLLQHERRPGARGQDVLEQVRLVDRGQMLGRRAPRPRGSGARSGGSRSPGSRTRPACRRRNRSTYQRSMSRVRAST